MAKAETVEAPAQRQILTKMSIATMRCNPGACKTAGADGNGGEMPLARIRGIARSIQEKIGKNGDAVYALIGSFRGTNLQNGKEFDSGVLYLPGGVQEIILVPLDNALSGTPDMPADPNASIQFGFDVFSFPAANPIGYSYSARDLFPQSRIDPLAELEAGLSQLALPKAA